MRFLVDTSVWIDHFKKKDDELVMLLTEDSVVLNWDIIGELQSGNLNNRSLVLEFLCALPRITAYNDFEIYRFIELHKIYGKGLSWIDLKIIHSAVMNHLEVLSRDKRLLSTFRGLQRLNLAVSMQDKNEVD